MLCACGWSDRGRAVSSQRSPSSALGEGPLEPMPRQSRSGLEGDGGGGAQGSGGICGPQACFPEGTRPAPFPRSEGEYPDMAILRDAWLGHLLSWCVATLAAWNHRQPLTITMSPTCCVSYSDFDPELQTLVLVFVFLMTDSRHRWSSWTAS